MIETPALYVVPTPLGNLADITERARTLLRDLPWVAAEDTRHSGLLLKHLGSSARLIAAHEHNEAAAAEKIAAKLSAGQSVALVCDAGTPGISDPGARIVAAVRAAGFRIVPLPGACAAITALSACGFSESPHLFHGFLPARTAQRRRLLEDLRELPYTLVFYEAPHRVIAAVEDMAACLGERTLFIARELTKLFEELHVCPLAEGAAWLASDKNRQKGEFVLVVSGAPQTGKSPERVLRQLLAEGLSTKDAARLAAALEGGSRKNLYEQALAIKGEKGESVSRVEREM